MTLDTRRAAHIPRKRALTLFPDTRRPPAVTGGLKPPSKAGDRGVLRLVTSRNLPESLEDRLS